MAGYNQEATVTLNAVQGSMTGITALQAGLVSINNQIQGLGNAVTQTGGIIDTMIASTAITVGLLGVKAAESYGQVEQAMKIVQQVSQQSAKDIEYLTEKSNQFSVQYRTDIDQITEGLQTLGRAGLNSASEQAEVLENGLQTAKLEGRELNSVLQELIQNTVLLGGNLKSDQFGEQTDYVNDLLVATSMTAPITTHDISETLKYSGGMLAAGGGKLGSDAGEDLIEDYMGTVAAFAQKGVTGSIAGTALRAFFNKPATQDSSVVDALASINLKPEYLWEEDEETMKPVSEQIAIIQGQMEKLNVSTMDQMQIWSKIVGGKMGQQMMKLDSSDIKELTKDIQSAKSAEELATRSMQTYQATVKEMGESGAVAFRALGEKIAMWLQPAAKILKYFFDLLSNPFINMGVFMAFTMTISAGLKVGINMVRQLKAELATAWKARGSVGVNEAAANARSQVNSVGTQISQLINRLQAQANAAIASTSAKAKASSQFATRLNFGAKTGATTPVVPSVSQQMTSANARAYNAAEQRVITKIRAKEAAYQRQLGLIQQETAHLMQIYEIDAIIAQEEGEISTLKRSVIQGIKEQIGSLHAENIQLNQNRMANMDQITYNNQKIILLTKIQEQIQEEVMLREANLAALRKNAMLAFAQPVNPPLPSPAPTTMANPTMGRALYIPGTNQVISSPSTYSGNYIPGYGTVNLNNPAPVTPVTYSATQNPGFLRRAWNQTKLSGAGRGLTTSLKGFSQGLGKAAKGLTSFLAGGLDPFTIAIMGATLAIMALQEAQQKYNEELQEAQQDVKDAYSSREKIEDTIKSDYRDQNPDAEKGEDSDFLNSIYADILKTEQDNAGNMEAWINATGAKTGLPKQYEIDSEADDGSMKEVEEEEKTYEQALGENTQALLLATIELDQATGKLVTKMDDGMWGIDGLASQISDAFGKLSDNIVTGNKGSSYEDEGEFLLTASQKDSNYAGYTELAGLMLEDFKDANGDWKAGMSTFTGSSTNEIIRIMDKSGKDAMNSMAKFSNSLTRSQNSRLQTSMKQDTKTWQALAKEMAKHEKKTGKHAMEDVSNKRMEALINKLQLDTHLSRQQVIAAAQLQQLQDMYQVAESTFIPLMSTQAQMGAQLYNTTATNVAPRTYDAAGGAISTSQNAAVIAAYLGVIAKQKAYEASYYEALDEGKTNADSVEQYIKEVNGTSISSTITGALNAIPGFGAVAYATGFNAQTLEDWGIKGKIGGNEEEQHRVAFTLEYMGDRIRNPTWTDEEVRNYSKRILSAADNFDDMMTLAEQNYRGAVAPQVEAAYLASDIGEDGSGSGGSGGGSGSGKDKDKDSGSKKERVDLVICNKKEIPKLNVNLFKKPPQFTILNKNFKLRDIKINTQDKPKAVLDSIKNAIIDTQKRMDPKIIQDEEAEYDPLAATEGKSTPSGSTDTTTDS